MKIYPIFMSVVVVLIVEVIVALMFACIPPLLSGVSVARIANFVPFYTFWVVVVAATILIVFGVPAFLALNHRSIATTKNLALVGLVIPVTILLIITAVFSVGDGFSSGSTNYGTHRDMIVDGSRTVWGWTSLGEQMLKFGIHGVIGAILFGRVWSKYQPTLEAI